MFVQTSFLTTKTPAAAVPLLQGEPPGQQLVNGLALILLLFVVGLCLVAFVGVLTALLPQVSDRSKAALLRSPWRAFFIGLANYLFLGGISLVLFDTGVDFLGLIGLILVTFLTVVSALGLTGLAKLTGERLAGLHNQEMTSLKEVVWGAAALSLATLLPVVGWFLLAPVLLMVSFGAAGLGWRRNRRPQPAEQVVEASSE